MVTVVEGDPKAPFSISTTPRYKGGRYSFLWITPLTLDLYLIIQSVEQGGIKYHFRVFGMIRPRIKSRSLELLSNTLTILPMGQLKEQNKNT